MVAPQIKLSYFNLTARAELSRLLFTFGGIAFEDNRVEFSAFGAVKPTLPLGQLPVLEVDGELFSQSGAIQRYAAKLTGLYPQDAVAALRADMISETLAELFTTYVNIHYHEKDAAVQAEKFKAFATEAVPKVFGVLEKLVQGKFFLGDNASIADIHLFDFVHNALNVSVPEFSMAAYPKLEGVIASVKANAHIAKYITK